MTLIPIGIYGGFVRGRKGTCSFLIEEDGFRIAIDAGSGFLTGLDGICSHDDISALLISHEHADHIADAEMAAFGRLISIQLGRPLPPLAVYGPEIPWLKSRLECRGSAVFSIVHDNEEFAIGPFSVTPYRMDHECICFGYLIKSSSGSVFYSADTAFSAAIASMIPHVDLMLAECSIYDRYGSGRPFGHMNGYETASFLGISRPDRALLVHLPCYGDNDDLLEEVRKQYSGDVQLAECGRTYII